MLGSVLGQYRIVGAIGRGGMGVVYAAEHVLLRRPAAVKVLLPELSQNSEVVTRFFNEARAATAIRHPGIIEIYDFGFHVDGSAYIAMELLQGESLATRMARGRMPPAIVLAIVRQLAGALGAAHAKGIVHRDLKPDNVFLVPDPEVPGGERIKLLDFGIAKLVDEHGHGHTRTGAVIGTPTYMAPEQCRGVTIDHRADLYSLGCIMFEMCAGQPPFSGEGTGDVLAAHIHVPPPAIGSLARDVPAELEQLVARLLVKDPTRRVQDARELIAAIDAAAGAQLDARAPVYPPRVGAAAATTPTTLSGAARVLTGSAPSGAMRSRAPLFAAAGVIAIATVLIIVVAKRPSGGATSAAAAAPVVEHAPVVAPAPIASAPVVTSAPIAPPVPAPVVAPAPPPVVPATIALALDSTPAGADVLLAGAVLGKTPFRGTLPRSDAAITLVVRLAGYADRSVTTTANAAVTESVTLDKKRVRVVAPRPKTDQDDSVNPFDH